MDFVSDKFLRLSGNMLDSYYYRYVLTGDDRVVLHTLWVSFLNKGTTSYSKGLLIANIKQKTLQDKIGNISYFALKQSLQKLHNVGVIIKIRQKVKHNRYFLGFRTEGNDAFYLLYHLIDKYEQMVAENIENQRYELKEKWKDPIIKDINPYCLNSTTKEFIMKHVDAHTLLTIKDGDGKTIYEILFDRNDCHKFKFSNLI